VNITRRTALKAALSVVVAPTIELRKHIDAERILAGFCDEDRCWRYDLDKPFGFGSLTYASDAHYMVRTELKSRIENGERQLPQKIDDTWNYWFDFDRSQLQPVEKPSLQSLAYLNKENEPTTCPECGGRRKFLGTKYPSPDEIEKFYDDGMDYDVDENTILDPSCGLCRGRIWRGPNIAMICGVPMDAWRVNRILTIPGVRVAPSRAGRCLAFEGSGFQGVAMGMIER